MSNHINCRCPRVEGAITPAKLGIPAQGVFEGSEPSKLVTSAQVLGSLNDELAAAGIEHELRNELVIIAARGYFERNGVVVRTK